MFDVSTLFVIIALLISFVGLSWFAGSDAPFIPTKNSKIKPVLKLAGVKKGINFYELGSGDGRVVIEASKLGAKSNGIEQSWIRIWYSRYLTKRLKLKNTHFYHGNLFNRNYYPADVIYIYLLPNAVDKLEKKLQKELKKGGVVITQTYHFKSWKPYKSQANFNFYKK